MCVVSAILPAHHEPVNKAVQIMEQARKFLNNCGFCNNLFVNVYTRC